MAITVGDIFVALRADDTQLRGDLDDARQKTTSWAQGLGRSITGALGGVVAAGATAAAGAVVSIGTAAFSSASQFSAATKQMQSQLALTDEQAQRYGDSIKNVFANNFGDSIDDVGKSISEVERAFLRIGGTESFGELESATESALALRDAFGVEVPEATEAAVELIDKFGLSSQQAFDFLASGYQQGLNASDDFLESVTEYSTQFSEGGATAGQFFTLLESGLQAGVLGTDKAADAFKEFRLRINDGSTLTASSLEMLGINAEAFTQKLSNGTLTTADAFDIVLDRLRSIEDPTVRIQAAVGLLGTQFEDLGDSAALGLSLSEANLDDMAGAISTLNKQYETLPTFFEGLRRRALVAITPIGEALLNVANEALPSIEAAFTRAETAIKKFIDNSSFTWEPDFKQIKLGDLFEFLQDDGVTKIEVGDWFTFTGFDNAVQVKIGDLFEFTSDSRGTLIDLADYLTVTWSDDGVKIKIGDLFALDTTEGTNINLADYLVIDYSPDGEPQRIKIGNLYELDRTGEKEKVTIGDVIEIESTPDESVTKIDLQQLFAFTTPITWNELVSLGTAIEVTKVTIGDLFNFGNGKTQITTGDVVDLSQKPEVSPFTLSDFFSWIGAGEGDSTQISFGDLFNFTADNKADIVKLQIGDFIAFNDGETAKITWGDIFNLERDNLGITKLEIGDLINLEGEGLGGLFADAATQFSEALGAPDWFVDLQAYTWPEIKEATKKTLDGLIAWVWPEEPATIAELLNWAWPDFGDYLAGTWAAIRTWAWPSFGGILQASIDAVLGWTWPEFETPAWISQFASAVSSLNSFSWPSLPSFSGGTTDTPPDTSGGGGGGGFSGAGGGPTAPQDEATSSSSGESQVVAAASATRPVIVNFYNTVINDAADVEELAYAVGQRIQYAT